MAIQMTPPSYFEARPRLQHGSEDQLNDIGESCDKVNDVKHIISSTSIEKTMKVGAYVLAFIALLAMGGTIGAAAMSHGFVAGLMVSGAIALGAAAAGFAVLGNHAGTKIDEKKAKQPEFAEVLKDARNRRIEKAVQDDLDQEPAVRGRGRGRGQARRYVPAYAAGREGEAAPARAAGYGF